MKTRWLAIVGLVLSALMTPPAQGAEIKVLAPNPARGSIDELVSRSQRATGHMVSARCDIQQTPRQIESGEPFDVVILSIDVEGLIKQGKVVADSRTVLGRTGVGVTARSP
jgi:hypothetical protein